MENADIEKQLNEQVELSLSDIAGENKTAECDKEHSVSGCTEEENNALSEACLPIEGTYYEYPMIGKPVNYMRANPDTGETFEGVGVLRALFIDPNNRLMGQVRDGKEAYNVDFACINPSEKVRKSYARMIKDVEEVSKKGNDLVRNTVSNYNKRVERLYNDVIGEPLNVE